ncbi:MAG TPA: glycosyltransferase [Longimicrobium sp.]|nr:glycosyltransferase [Longimicrobium sp.]
MKIVVFGLTLSSSWGNGHATLWRGLARALIRRGHRFVFFEKDVPYYAGTRDLWEIPGGELVLYPEWESVLPYAKSHLADADVAMVTSYCPDAIEATRLSLDSPAQLRTFYDMDTPVTLDGLQSGGVAYLPPEGLSGFDLVLSFTGGPALAELRTRLGARRTAPLYGHVDPDVHRPVPALDGEFADVSYLGTYAADRQAALEALFIEPARRMPERRFLIAGAQYPHDFPWTDNVFFRRHLPPPEHPAFFGSSGLTVNVTRRAMARMGWCPSGRLFEAAACGVPILSDTWDGLGDFFTPGDDILTAATTDEAISAISLPRSELARIGAAARERVLAQHTSDVRAAELEALLDAAVRGDGWSGDDDDVDAAEGTLAMEAGA